MRLRAISASQYMSSIAYGASCAMSASKMRALKTVLAPQITLTTRNAFCPRLIVAWYDQYMNARIAINGFQRRRCSQIESIRPDAAAVRGHPQRAELRVDFRSDDNRQTRQVEPHEQHGDRRQAPVEERIVGDRHDVRAGDARREGERRQDHHERVGLQPVHDPGGERGEGDLLPGGW